MSNTWFRMYNNFMDDPKMLSLAFEDQRHFIAILALKSSGVLDQKYANDDMLNRVVAQKLWIDYAAISEVKKRLCEALLINSKWQPVAWEKHKPNSRRPPSHVWRSLRSQVFRRDDYTCSYCGERGGRLECDHIIPVKLGGDHELENLTTACFSCNRSKHSKLLSDWGAC